MIYFVFVILLCVVATVLTIIVLQLHLRSESKPLVAMPAWVSRTLYFGLVAYVRCVNYRTMCTLKGKGKSEHLYRALHGTNHLKALRHGSHSYYLQRTPCLPLPRKRSPDGASTECGGEHLIAAHYSFINPERMKGWVGLVGWPIADGVPT